MKLCECGCGRPAPIAKRNYLKRGIRKGEPLRFIWGHNGVKHGKCRRDINQNEYKREWARQKRKKMKEMMTEEERKVVEERKKQTRFKKGQIPWNKGKKTGLVPRTAGQAATNSEIREKIRIATVELWKTESYRQKNRTSWKGNFCVEETGRARARKLFPLLGNCEICGGDAKHRHHKDGDTKNNNKENIEILCVRCHLRKHREERRLAA